MSDKIAVIEPIEPIDDNWDDDNEFIPCSKCDGHPACEDFGCAYELGCGHLVEKEITNSITIKPHNNDTATNSRTDTK
jgi:hypothetical protein